MKHLRLGAAVLNQTPLDWSGNLRRILGAIEDARAREVDLLCLPELCITGYGCEDAFLARFVQETALDLLGEIERACQGIVVAVGLPFCHHHGLFNTAALIAGGKLAGFVAKQHLAGDGIHYEPRWFKPWREGVRTEVDALGARVAFGDLVFDVGGVRIGFEICEDAWVASRPGARLAAIGTDVILNPSASHFAFGKRDVRERFVTEGSRTFGVSYVYANLLGNEAGRAIYDGGALIASHGMLIARGPRLGYTEQALTCALVDVDLTRTAHGRTSSFQPELCEPPGLVSVAHVWPARAPEPALAALADWERSETWKEEELTRAVALGLFDYLRKSRSQGFVVSLSGGADSSAVCCLVRLMTELALNELGLPGLQERLAYVRGIERCEDVAALMRRLLTTLYQPSANSGETTRNAAQAVAQLAGCRHVEIGIAGVIADYTALVSHALGRELSWQHDDIALQNIQARARGPSAWLIANLEGALLLATSNRSEAALGYATMDGDTCGGLSPLAGIDKAFLRHWLRWLETCGPIGLAARPELSAVTAQASTPELRPQASQQTSEADLMPFAVLDRIERHLVRDRRSPAEALALLGAELPELASATLREYVVRFYTLFARNQWKRERYAPSFHLDDQNLDPKTWFRFPILSGAFERELAELGRKP